jgi:hypothetical protein
VKVARIILRFAVVSTLSIMLVGVPSYILMHYVLLMDNDLSTDISRAVLMASFMWVWVFTEWPKNFYFGKRPSDNFKTR